MKYMYIFWFRPCCHQADRPVGNEVMDVDVSDVNGDHVVHLLLLLLPLLLLRPPPSFIQDCAKFTVPPWWLRSMAMTIKYHDEKEQKNHDNNVDDMVHLLTNLVCTSSGFCSGWSGCQGDHPLLCRRQPDQEYDGDGYVVTNITTIMSDLWYHHHEWWPQGLPSEDPELGGHCVLPSASAPCVRCHPQGKKTNCLNLFHSGLYKKHMYKMGKKKNCKIINVYQGL